MTTDPSEQTGAERRIDSTPDPARNQGKTEPVPPTGAHGSPDAAPQSSSDDLGGEAGTLASADPQSARVGGLLPPAAAPPGSAATGPAQQTGGAAQRAPGSLGTTPEPIATDLDTSAARTQPGSPPVSVPPADNAGATYGVSVPGTEAAATGTSEQSGVVRGARTPTAE